MSEFHIQDLKSKTGTFARGYLFNIYFDSAPVDITGGENIASYLVRSSSLPESSIDPIEVPWQGQTYKIGSTHTFSDWSCTFNIDRTAEINKKLLEWQRRVHDPATNIQGIPRDYFGTIKLELLDVVGSIMLTYTLHLVWPSSVGAVDLAQDNKDIAQFDCTFNYNWHTTQ